MALVRSTLFDIAKGSFASLTLRERRNGRIELGKKRVPTDPQSTAQLDNRTGYGRLLETWKTASWIDTAQYDRLAAVEQISPWNAWVKRYQSSIHNNQEWCWTLENDGSGYLDPILPSTNKLQNLGAAWIQYGKADLNAVQFNGSSSYLQATSSAELRLLQSESLILSCTVRMPNISGIMPIIQSLDYAPAYEMGYWIRILDSGRVEFMVFDNTFPGGMWPFLIVGGKKIKDNKWHTITGIRDQSNGKGYLYIDGELMDVITDQTTSLIDNGAEFLVGKDAVNVFFLQGDIAGLSVAKWVP